MDLQQNIAHQMAILNSLTDDVVKLRAIKDSIISERSFTVQINALLPTGGLQYSIKLSLVADPIREAFLEFIEKALDRSDCNRIRHQLKLEQLQVQLDDSSRTSNSPL